MVIVSNSPTIFKYIKILPVGGRGGVTRFFMLSQGIPFEEQLFSVDQDGDWSAEKQRLLQTGENPSGSSPNLYSTDGKAHPQHIAVSRYLARVHQVTSGDDYKDYVQDLVADEYQGFRSAWVEATFNGNDDDKATYKAETLPKQLTKFNSLYSTFKTTDVYLSVSAKTGQPLWGDAAIFGLLRDHILTKYLSVEDLAASYPNLSALYANYEKIPAVHEWLSQFN